MTQGENFLGELLADPGVVAQLKPLLDAAIEARLAPLTAQVEQLAQGVTLIAQATVDRGQGQPEPQPPQAPPQFGPQGPAPQTQNGLAPPYQPMAPAQPPAADRLGALAPLLAQYLHSQTQGQGNSLSNMAETLAAAAQISNVMNAPMFQGMRMATDMMSMAGRAGIEPTTAADTLGGMIDATHPAPTGAAPGQTP
jgi:hypothetical protein